MGKLFNARVIPCALLFLAAGVVAGLFLNVAWLLGLFGGAAVISLVVIHKNNSKKARALFALFFILLGMSSSLIFHAANANRAVNADGARITGRVTVMTRHDPGGAVVGGTALFIDNARITRANGTTQSVPGVVRVSAANHPALSIGDSVTLQGDLRAIPFRAGDSFSAMRFRNRIYHSFSANSFISAAYGSPRLTERIKIAARLTLHENTSGATADFIYAMMFGDSGYLDDGLRAEFRAVGAAHLFAVSGLHIAVLAGALMGLLKLCGLSQKRSFLITFPVLLFYGAICAFSPSVMRALLMFLIWQIGRMSGMRADGISSISLAALILLIIRPFYIFDLSFLLSFMAVIGINFNVGRFLRVLTRDGAVKNRVALAFLRTTAITTSVNIAVFPITLHYFGSFSFLFVIANTLLVPIVSVLFPIIVPLVLISAALPPLGVAVTAVAMAYTVITLIAALLSRIPWTTVEAELPWAIIPLHAAGLTFTSRYCFLSQKAKTAIACATAALLVVAVGYGILFV